MIMRTIAVLLLLSPTTLWAASLTEQRLMMACPDAGRVTVMGREVSIHNGTGMDDDLEECLRSALAEVKKNPFPVNTSGSPEATRVKKVGGKIVLY